MVLHPGIIALYTGSLITLLMTFFAGALGLRIILHWDINSSSEIQLRLERRTYLVSTIIQYALFYEILSAFLFVYTADDLHNLLTGAMCATGSLNSNPYGFPALYAKLGTLFLASAWIALNHIDNRAEDYPLTKIKYALLLFFCPVLLAADTLQVLFFINVDPSVITSCCGSLFSEGRTGLSSSIASLPLKETRAGFFGLFMAVVLTGFLAIRNMRPSAVTGYALLSLIFLGVSVASVISFISLYFYQIPTHHCPFDILQSHYLYVGYPLYASLFTGGFFGIMAGLAGPFRRITSLTGVVPGIQRSWIIFSVAAFSAFVILSLIPMIFTSFTLEGY